MSSPTEKSNDQNGCKHRHTQGLSKIDLICQPKPQPLPLSAPQPVPLLPPVKTTSSSTSPSDEFSGLTNEKQNIKLVQNLIFFSQGGNLIDQVASPQSCGTTTSQSELPSIEMEKVSKVVEIKIERHDTVVPSRRPVESTAPATNREYMCDNCNKRFKSIQGLVSHRANHKKPKLDKSDEPKVQSTTNTGRTSSSIALKLEDTTNIQNEIQVNPPVVRPPVHTADNKARTHQCEECSAVFSSGQALGGHMRKHRPLNKDGDASKNKKFKIETQEPPEDGLDRIAIQQPPNGSLDRAAIQQPANDGLSGGLDRFGIVQQQANGDLNLALSLRIYSDHDDTMQLPPAKAQQHDADPQPTIRLFGTDIKSSRD